MIPRITWPLVLATQWATCSAEKRSSPDVHRLYASSEELRSQYDKLAGEYRTGTVTTKWELSAEAGLAGVFGTVEYVPKQETDQAERIYLSCGMHARELIGPEVCLAFFRNLLKEASASTSASSYSKLLKHRLLLVPNVNPLSRDGVVVDDDDCRRFNERNVDLNRNFAPTWRATEQGAGPTANSEAETRAITRIVQEYQPLIALDVHSGEYAFFLPYASELDKVPDTFQTLMDVGRAINAKKYVRDGKALELRLPYGHAAKMLGTEVAGSFLDFGAFNARYSAVIELYGRHPWQDSSFLKTTYTESAAGTSTWDELHLENEGPSQMASVEAVYFRKSDAHPSCNFLRDEEVLKGLQYQGCLHNWFCPLRKHDRDDILSVFPEVIADVFALTLEKHAALSKPESSAAALITEDKARTKESERQSRRVTKHSNSERVDGRSWILGALHFSWMIMLTGSASLSCCGFYFCAKNRTWLAGLVKGDRKLNSNYILDASDDFDTNSEELTRLTDSQGPSFLA